MTTNHVQGAESCAQRLPSLERPCACPGDGTSCGPDYPHDSLCICEGTGKVPQFPTLRRECRACSGYGKGLSSAEVLRLGVVQYIRAGTDCGACGGRGWVADVTLEKLLVAMDSIGWELHSLDKDGTSDWCCSWVFPEYDEDAVGLMGVGGDPLTAAVIAACKAISCASPFGA